MSNVSGHGMKDFPKSHKELLQKVKNLSKTEKGHSLKLSKTPNGAKILTHYKAGKIVTKTSFHPHYDETNESEKDAEGSSARVEKTKKKERHKKLVEVSTELLKRYIRKSYRDTKKAENGPTKDYYSRITKRGIGRYHAQGKLQGLTKVPAAGVAVKEAVGKEFNANRSLAMNKSLSDKSKGTSSYFDYNDKKLSAAAKAVLSKRKTASKLKEATEDKYKKAAKKIILSKKAKGNKHVETEPTLNLPDKGGTGPMETNHTEQENAKV